MENTVFLLVLLIVQFVAILTSVTKKLNVPLLVFTLGSFGLVIALPSIADSTLPYQPYFSMMCIFVALIAMISSGIDLRAKKH